MDLINTINKTNISPIDNKRSNNTMFVSKPTKISTIITVDLLKGMNLIIQATFKNYSFFSFKISLEAIKTMTNTNKTTVRHSTINRYKTTMPNNNMNNRLDNSIPITQSKIKAPNTLIYKATFLPNPTSSAIRNHPSWNSRKSISPPLKKITLK
jgi:hypothetical protein